MTLTFRFLFLLLPYFPKVKRLQSWLPHILHIFLPAVYICWMVSQPEWKAWWVKESLKSDSEEDPDKYAKHHTLSLPVGMFIRSNEKGKEWAY